MAKEEYETPLIDAYNRLHRDPLREDGSWFSRFLPEGIQLEELGEAVEQELIAVFSQAEKDAEQQFVGLVEERFKGLLEAQKEVDFEEYMPQKPEPMNWEDLPEEHQKELAKILNECQASQFNKRTIRKRFRTYIEKAELIALSKGGETS